MKTAAHFVVAKVRSALELRFVLVIEALQGALHDAGDVWDVCLSMQRTEGWLVKKQKGSSGGPHPRAPTSTVENTHRPATIR